MTEKNIEKEYKKLAAKHSLPSFKDMDAHFEISSIEDDKHLLTAVRKKVAEKVEQIADIVQEIVQPENNAAGLYESRTFSEDEKSEIFDTFKRLRVLLRASHVALLKEAEQSDVEFIKRVTSEWPKLKEKLVPVLEELENCWKEFTDTDEKLSYYG